MSSAPRVFISATSRDLGSYRKAVAGVLLTRDWHPTSQDHFAPDYREVHAALREKIKKCAAVICLIGRRYGEEPAKRQPGEPRRSYTQMEYDIAEKLGKPIFRFLTADDCPVDNPNDPPEEDERTALQRAYRTQIESSDHLRRSFASLDDLLQQVRVIQLPRPPQIGLWIGIGIVLLSVLGLASYFALPWFFYDDPCSKKNEFLLTIPDEEVSSTLLRIVQEKSFVETAEKPQQPPHADQSECHFRIVNETGRPLRVWRYFPNPSGSDEASARPVESAGQASQETQVSGSTSIDPKAYRPWRSTPACRASSPKVPAIGGWSYFFVEDLGASLKEARQRTSSPDDGGRFSWFRPTMKGWEYLPYGKDSLIRIKQGFFDDTPDPGAFAVIPEQ